MTEHRTGTREEWRRARVELLELEKEHTRRGDELARMRRELPRVRIDKPYEFETDEGTKTLAELFDGRWQADEAVIASYAERLRHRLPGIPSTPVRSHAGIYHMTPDRQPILGPVAGIAGLFLAVGFCYGFKLAPVIGRLLASCVHSGIESTPEIGEFDHARFEHGALIHPRFTYAKAYAG